MSLSPARTTYGRKLMENICLIAESDPFIARLLERFAQKSGLQTVHAQIGQDVLDILRETKPAVMVLDPELPGKTRGWDILNVLRLDEELSRIPVIACTWLDESECVARFGKLNGYLQKPAPHLEAFLDAIMHAGIDVKSNVASRD